MQIKSSSNFIRIFLLDCRLLFTASEELKFLKKTKIFSIKGTWSSSLFYMLEYVKCSWNFFSCFSLSFLRRFCFESLKLIFFFLKLLFKLSLFFFERIQLKSQVRFCMSRKVWIIWSCRLIYLTWRTHCVWLIVELPNSLVWNLSRLLMFNFILKLSLSLIFIHLIPFSLEYLSL